MRCKEIWTNRYPSEPFENEMDSDSSDNLLVIANEDILTQVKKQRFLYLKFSEPYMREIVYLIAARQRYKGFLFMLSKFTDECSCFVPAFDIQLMWLTHLVGLISSQLLVFINIFPLVLLLKLCVVFSGLIFLFVLLIYAPLQLFID